ncbi:reverse transcriptase [Elysia marginata]|uniref:Reverse transcriptase n=1 Tax=Elysia marginata TaxID=1093978 RepID=A0AAV4G8Q7_9GAST|nr:reverse transcriptase [Elysia marginata]
MATRLTKYLTENGYINTSVQKGGIPGVSGCLEHATMIWEAIQRAKSEKLNLDVVCLDLANAYGSVPQEMIQLALRMYHVPEDIQVLLDDYFSGFRMRFSTSDYTTNWINLEVGIAMGCTISPILFVMAMEVILKAAEGSAGPANLGGGCSMPPLKAFMDGTTIICSKEEETRRMLARLDTLMTWCRMKFKPKKSRSLSIRKGKIEEAVTFTVAEQQISTVSQEPVKSLGRWYDSSMKDTRRGVETVQFASEGLLAINKCGIQGKLKVWCLQFMLIPKLLWPLLVYDICCSTVESIEAKINKYTRIWLGVPPGLSDVAMYCRKAKLKLPMKSILEEYKCGKVRLVTMLEESDDPVVKTVQPSIKTGRKWKVAEAIDEAKECLRLKEVRQREDVRGIQKAVQQPQQGQWTNWDSAIQRSLTWKDIWQITPLRISFLIRSVYDLLPSNANLVRWGKKDDPACPLCHGRQTTEHVLSSCKVALSQGRYTWRHNRVLQELASVISTAKGQSNPPSPNFTIFTTEGGARKWCGRSNTASNQRKGLLEGCDDWEVSADLPEWDKHPEVIRKIKA